MQLRTVFQWMCSDGCLYACRCKALAWLVYIFGVLLVGPDTYSSYFVFFKIKYVLPEYSRVNSLRKCVRKDADTSYMADFKSSVENCVFLFFAKLVSLH